MASERCVCPCHTHSGTYPPPCSYCGHDTREGRWVGGYRGWWEPNNDPRDEQIARLTALLAERDARIKTLENDLEHALASVGAFRQAIETIFAKAEEHEIDQGGMIVTYVLPCGPLHRAIGLARGTDAGGKLLKRLSDTEAERDAAVARAERAEELLRTMAGVHCDPKCSSVGHFKLCAQARATLAAASDSISHSGESSRLSE